MRRAWKVLLSVLAVFVVLIGGGLAYVLNIDPNEYKADIAAAVKEETGRDLSLTGPITLEIGSQTRLRVEGVALSNAQWGSQPDMLKVDEFEAVIRLIPTLFGTPDISKIRLSGVNMLVEQDASGRSNLDFSPDGEKVREAKEQQQKEREKIEAPDGAEITVPILRDVEIRDITVRMINAQTGQNNTFRLDHLTLSGQGPDAPLTLDTQAAFDDLPILMAGTLGAPATMLDNARRWDINLAGNLAGIDVAADGGIMDPTTGRGIDLSVRAIGAEVADIAQKLGLDVPKVGAFEVRTILKGDSDGDLAAQDITVDIGSTDFIKVSAKGQVASLTRAAGIDIQTSISGTETGNLSPLADRFAGQTIPDMGPYQIGMRLSGGLEKGIALTGLDAAMGRPSLVLLSAKGGIANLIEASGIDITLAARSNEIGALSDVVESYSGQKVPALGPLDFGGRLVGDAPIAGRQSRMAVKDLDVKLGKESLVTLAVVGGVEDVIAANGLDLTLKAQSPEVGRLDSIVKAYSGGQGMPALGPLDVTVAVDGGMGSRLGIPRLSIDFGRPETMRLTAEGSVTDALKGSGADMNFAFAAKNMAILSQAVGGEVPAIGPVKVTGMVKAGADEPVTLSPFEAKIGDSDLSGTMTLDLTKAIPEIVAQLSSQRFDTADIMGQADNASSGAKKSRTGLEAGAPQKGTKKDDGRIIPNDPLPFDVLSMVQADIRYTAGEFVAQGSAFDNLNLAVTLKDARLAVERLSADVGAGTLKGSLSLDGAKKPAPLVVDITGENMDLGRLGGAAGLRDKMEGPMDLRIDVQGQGNSPREIAASLNGAFNFVIVDSRVKRKAVEDAMGTSMASLADMLFGNQGEWVVVNCALSDYTLSNGVASGKAIYVDTDVSTVTGDGDVDLTDESLSIGLKPQTGLFSLPLLVTGTLASPSVIPDPGKTLLSVGGALLTGGGLTAALAVLSASLPEDHPCMNSAEAAQKQAEEDANKSTGEKVLGAPLDAVRGAEGAVKGITDGINKLLGQ